jgi:hypothetical protein
MSASALRPTSRLVPFSAGLIYLAGLSAIMAAEARETRLLVAVFLAFSVLAGLVIRRFTALLLPLGVIAIAMVWFPNVDEDPLVAMVVGLLAGILLGRMYERAPGQTATSAGTTDARAHRWPTVRHLVKRVVTREGVDKVLDYVRFRIDTFPQGIYQPVASLPIRTATRGTGSESRWEAIFPVLGEQAVKSAVDIGACEGYFSIKLGSAGIPTIALEGYPATYRTALYAVRRSGLDNVGVLALELNPDNIVAVPAADAVLCLSVWHHLVRYQGLAGATEMMKTIWDRTDKVLFFDTGENEMTPDYGLPEMTPDARSWLSAYLAATCEGSRIEHLGTHAAFDPSGRPVERDLFAVIRV